MGNHLKALVTGGTGFIGSHLIETLLRKEWEVLCLIREESAGRLPAHEGLESFTGDLRDKDSLKRCFAGVTVVFHLAGRIKGRNREEYFDTNWQGTKNLLEAAREHADDLNRFIYVSSLSAAGPSSDGHLLTEDEEAHPVSFYGESKLAAEREAARFSTDFPIVVLRPAAVYGPRDAETLQVIKLAGWGIRFQTGREGNLFSAVHVADLVSALLSAAERPVPDFRTFFIADGNEYTWEETFDILVRNLGRKHLSVAVPWRPARTGVRLLAKLFPGSRAALYLDKIKEMSHNYWVCDTGRAGEELNFRPRYDLNQGLEETIRWYRNKGWL